MAFPLLLFLIFASVRLRPELMAIAYGSALPQGVVGVAVLIGVFTSFYPTRLVRSQLLTLRNAEFIEAEHMVGASDWRILRKHLFPHLIPTLLIWGAIAVATNILLEVGLSFIGVGVQPETATWGSMLSTTWGTIYNPTTYNSHAVTVWLTVFPTVAILLTVAALNQLSEGVRRALEPWAAR
jgi:ABC-type dipeptide/oligopeptide/nickel transport system permease subunit